MNGTFELLPMYFSVDFNSLIVIDLFRELVAVPVNG